MNIPTFPGFKLEKNDRYQLKERGQLFRLGIKLNTPDVCNWACPYCYVGNKDAEERPKLLASDVISNGGNALRNDPEWARRMESWICEGVDLGVKAVTINGTFEPTTSPDYLRIIEFCVKHGLNVTLVTNGTQLKYSDLKNIYDMGANILTKLNVPMVGQDDPRYQTFCDIQEQLSGLAVPAEKGYELRRELIDMMIDIGFNQCGVTGVTRMGLESVITSLNLDYLPELVAQCREHNFYSHIEVTKIQGYAHNNAALGISRESLQELFNTIRSNDIASGYPDWEPRPPYIAGACHENLFRLDIHANGTVKPCPGIETTIGDLNSTSMREIANSDALNIIRNLEDNIQGDCKECELFASRECYGGCRGTVYQSLKQHNFSEYDAWTASDPSCWRVSSILDDGTKKQDVFN